MLFYAFRLYVKKIILLTLRLNNRQTHELTNIYETKTNSNFPTACCFCGVAISGG